METTPDLDAFLADFGVDVIGPSGVEFRGILNQPDRVFGDDIRVISTEYELTFRTDAVSTLKRGDTLTIDSEGFEVREVLKQSDGAFSVALLSKADS